MNMIWDREYEAAEVEYQNFLEWCAETGHNPEETDIEAFRDWRDNALLDAQEDAAEAAAERY